MPAKSKAQQRFMAMCSHNPSHASGTCPDMSVEDMRDFAKTPRKGLPEHTKPKKKDKK